MRNVIAAVTLTACLHQPAITPREQCGAQGMIPGAITYSQGGASSLAVGPGGVAGASGESYGLGVSCVRPNGPEEICETLAAQAALTRKVDYDVDWRNLLIGVGFVAFIVPGLVLDVSFHLEESSVESDAEGRFKSTYATCIAKYQR